MIGCEPSTPLDTLNHMSLLAGISPVHIWTGIVKEGECCVRVVQNYCNMCNIDYLVLNYHIVGTVPIMYAQSTIFVPNIPALDSSLYKWYKYTCQKNSWFLIAQTKVALRLSVHFFTQTLFDGLANHSFGFATPKILEMVLPWPHNGM